MSHNAIYVKLINSTEWRKLRLKKLGSQPLCERCLEMDRVKPASQVHHIVPVESEKTLPLMARLCYDYTNLMSLCPKCHQAIHKEMERRTPVKSRDDFLAIYRRHRGIS